MLPDVVVRVLTACVSFVLTGCQLSGSADIFDNVMRGPSLKAAPVVAPFVRDQLRHPRVREARELSEDGIMSMFHERKISYPADEIFVRVLKLERELELWVRPTNSDRFELLRTYPICALAGVLGPKRVEGDRQVPEGFYTIDLFNPNSSYHLSLRINYPNRRDRAANLAERPLGGDIFIHGGCRSDGCLAITDQGIRELYWIAVMTKGFGQQRIPVHIFPTRMHDGKEIRKIGRLKHFHPSVLEFWDSLKPGYDYFEKHRKLPDVDIDGRGRYRVEN
jgi:murein L,D-transpeptidase YafK